MKRCRHLCRKLSSDIEEQRLDSLKIEFAVGWTDWIGLNPRSLAQFMHDNMNLLRIQALKLKNS